MKYIRLTENDTYRWARRPNNQWPNSKLSGHSVIFTLAENGDLVDIETSADIKELSNAEVSAIISDFKHKAK